VNRVSWLAGSLLPAALLAAFGSAVKPALAVRASSITVAIEVKVNSPRARDTRYSLGCDPTVGTLPSAARVCALIAAHPVVMLRPRSSLTLCYARERGPFVSVRATWNGRTTLFSGQPGCGWPGLSALTVYYNAAIGRARLIG
jgi:hypothetical protein